MNGMRRLKREEGVALVVVVGVMFVLMLLSAAIASSAVQSSDFSNHERKSKVALAAAEAGLGAATYRLQRLQPVENLCVTNAVSAPNDPSGACVWTDSIGNGASYTYYVTPDLGSPGLATLASKCGTTTPSGERCITAVGTVGGVSRRIQVRVSKPSPFRINGLVGLKRALIESNQSWSGPNFVIDSHVGSNGPITLGQNVNAPSPPWKCYLGPSATGPGGCQTQLVPGGLTAVSVDSLPFEAASSSNQNAGLTPAQGYTAAGRTLVLAANATLTLGTGSSSSVPANYSFCNITMGNGSKIVVPTGGVVRIYLDSPARSGSGCAAGTGKFTTGADSAQLNPSSGTTAEQLEIYVYGTSAPAPPSTPPPPATCGSDFTWTNGSPTNQRSSVFVYAPNSIVDITNNSPLEGAVVSCELKFWALSAASTYQYTGPLNPIPGQLNSVRGSWRECTTRNYAADPMSACTG